MIELFAKVVNDWKLLTIFARRSSISDVWQGSEYDSHYFYYLRLISSVIRQKGEFQNGCFKKTKRAKFSEKRTFLTPWFVLLPYYRWFNPLLQSDHYNQLPSLFQVILLLVSFRSSSFQGVPARSSLLHLFPACFSLFPV